MNQITILLISHSEKIANGVKELIEQITRDVPVEMASGTEGNGLGTSMKRINDALKNIAPFSKVLIFYDLGSAKMNAQFAIETNPGLQAEIVDAPFVEGAYIAAVKASIGKSYKDIVKDIKSFFPKTDI